MFDDDGGDSNDNKSAENADRNDKPFDILTGACRAAAQGDYTIVRVKQSPLSTVAYPGILSPGWGGEGEFNKFS